MSINAKLGKPKSGQYIQTSIADPETDVNKYRKLPLLILTVKLIILLNIWWKIDVNGMFFMFL